jgi:hypothetical protein
MNKTSSQEDNMQPPPASTWIGRSREEQGLKHKGYRQKAETNHAKTEEPAATTKAATRQLLPE